LTYHVVWRTGGSYFIRFFLSFGWGQRRAEALFGPNTLFVRHPHSFINFTHFLWTSKPSWRSLALT